MCVLNVLYIVVKQLLLVQYSNPFLEEGRLQSPRVHLGAIREIICATLFIHILFHISSVKVSWQHINVFEFLMIFKFEDLLSDILHLLLSYFKF